MLDPYFVAFMSIIGASVPLLIFAMNKIGKNFDAIQRQLDSIRQEVNTDLVAFRQEMNSRFSGVESKIERVDARIDDIYKTFGDRSGQLPG